MAAPTATDWIECSHPIDADTVRVPFLPRPALTTVPDASLRATEVSIATHVGTHLEAPCHLLENGRSIDAYPADRWFGSGAVVEVDAEPLEEIEADQIDPPVPLEPGDALLIRTGWEDRIGEESYFEQPYLSATAAAWIADRGVSWIGIDSPSPEMPAQLRDADFDYPVHRTLLENDVPIAEHLTNLAPLTGQSVEVIALPLRYVGSDGSQARIVARPRE